MVKLTYQSNLKAQIVSDLINLPSVQADIVSYRLEQLQQLKKRKRGAFNSKLMRHAELIFLLKDQHSASFSDIALYLWRFHRVKVSRQNVGHFYRKIVKESILAHESSSENYWGEAGR